MGVHGFARVAGNYGQLRPILQYVAHDTGYIRIELALVIRIAGKNGRPHKKTIKIKNSRSVSN